MTTITAPTDLAAVLTTEHMLHYLATATTLDALHRSWLRLFLAAGRAAVTSLRYDTLFPLTGMSVFATVVSTYDQVATSFTKVIAGHGSLGILGVALENAVRARANAVQVLCHYERQVRRDVAVVLPHLAPQIGHLVQEWLATADQIPATPAALYQHIVLVQSLMGTLTELQVHPSDGTGHAALASAAMLALLAPETDGGAALMQVLMLMPAPADLVALVVRAGAALRTLQTHTVTGSPEAALLFVTAVGDLALAYCQWGKGTDAPMESRYRAALATLALQEPLFHDWLAQQEATTIIGQFGDWPSSSPLKTYLVALTGSQFWNMLDGRAYASADGSIIGPIPSAEVAFLPDWANALHMALLAQYEALGEGAAPMTVGMVLTALAGAHHGN